MTDKLTPEQQLQKTKEQLKERETDLFKINQEVYKKNLELLKEKKRLETILYNMAEAVFVLDSNRKFTLFNNTAQKLFGTTEPEVLGEDCDSVINLYSDQGARVLSPEFIKLSSDSSAYVKIDFILHSNHGERVVNINVSQVKLPYEDRLEYVVLMKDITVEKEIAKLKDEFIGIVSHELRTPMTAIKGYLWMLANGRGGEITDKAKGYLTKAMHGTDRMIALIADILSASSLEQGRIDLKVESVSLKDLVLEELDELRARAEQRGLSLEISDFDNLPNVYGDKRRIIEVLANYIVNAIKYTNAGFVKVGARSDGGFVRVEVTDSGKGFTDLEKNNLFKKFGRLDNSLVTVAEASGTGLGLYISKMLIEKMSGQVGAQSTGAGKGSTFWFSLPIAGAWRSLRRR
jgi:PAS domain S-box-containing protein